MSAEARRVVAVVLAVAAAVLLVVSVFSHSWLVNSDRRLYFGLRAVDTDGVMWTNHEVIESALENGHQKVVPLFPPAGTAAFVLGLVSAALVVASAVVRRAGLASLARLAFGAALIAGIVFVATKPEGPAFGVSPGWSAWLFAAGVVTGVVAAALAGGPATARPSSS